MLNDTRVQSLLDKLLDSDATPEEVCRNCPELLPEVQQRWRRLHKLRVDLDDLLPVKDREATLASCDLSELPQIPGYEVEELLGRGGMGVVFRARHVALKRHVAVKMTLAGVYASANQMARFQREAEAVARLRHPNVVPIYDTGQWQGRSFFTMELIEGGSLAQTIKHEAQPARASAELVATLAGAIDVAHASGVVHRDLKPANILLTIDGTPKITDFGLAMQLEGNADLTRTGTALGTLGYMAPEQARGVSAQIGPPADIHGLGAILYELLTGRPPYGGDSPGAIMEQLLLQDPVAPSLRNASIPRDLEVICLKCLHKEPHRRYPSAAALRDDLQRFLQGEAIAARPEATWERLVRRVRRSPWQSASIAAAIACLIALAISGLWFVSERTAAAQHKAHERRATELAVAEDLQSMNRFMSRSSWPEAHGALERARGRLGNLPAEPLQKAVQKGEHDLALVKRLDSIRLDAVEHDGRKLQFDGTASSYVMEFRENGYGEFIDEPASVAARIRESNIAKELIAALDHWFISTSETEEKKWIAEVAKLADLRNAKWRHRACQVLINKNNGELLEILATIPVHEQPSSLLLALEYALEGANEDRLKFLKRIQRAHPEDLWVNLRLASVCHTLLMPREAVGYYQAACAVRPRTAIVLNNLGIALAASGREAESVECYLEALSYDATLEVVHVNLVSSLWALKRYDEAVKQMEIGLSEVPNSSALHAKLGQMHEARRMDDDALKAYRRAVELDPREKTSLNSLRNFLTKHGEHAESQRVWREAISVDPTTHATRYGYAEYCLYVKLEDEYLLARTDLLKNFASTRDPNIAERTSRACLLRPLQGDELWQAVQLADYAAQIGAERKHPAHPHFLFTQALARYRQGQYAETIAILGGPAGKVLGPAPNLVLAMALYRQNRVEAARETLQKAIASHNWDRQNAVSQDGWIYHVLRHEAEELVNPPVHSGSVPLSSAEDS